jgi:hypothetical protein
MAGIFDPPADPLNILINALSSVVVTTTEDSYIPLFALSTASATTAVSAIRTQNGSAIATVVLVAGMASVRWVPVTATSPVAVAIAAAYTGSYLAQAVSLAHALAAASGAVDNQVGVTAHSDTWVVNLETGAASQYDAFGFNSFSHYDGGYLAAASDGIYQLAGSTYAGTPIGWQAQLPVDNFGTSHKKRFPDIWIGVSSTNAVYLKVVTEDDTYIYQADTRTAGLQENHIETGRGLEGTYWTFTLQGTASAEIESIDFTPIVLQQKR